jgi:hypothetical protein
MAHAGMDQKDLSREHCGFGTVHDVHGTTGVDDDELVKPMVVIHERGIAVAKLELPLASKAVDEDWRVADVPRRVSGNADRHGDQIVLERDSIVKARVEFSG